MSEKRTAIGLKGFMNPTEFLISFIYWPMIIATIPLIAGHTGVSRGEGYVLAALTAGFVLAPLLFATVKFVVLVVVVPKRELTGIEEFNVVHTRLKRITGWVHMIILAASLSALALVLRREGVL